MIFFRKQSQINKKMKSDNAIKIFLLLLLTVCLFHVFIILKIIPYNIAWGGRLTNDTEMYIFETVSILVNLFLCWILLMKGEFVKFRFSPKIVRIILWLFCILFILNTAGNIFAKTNFEKCFSLLTGLSAILIWMILKQKHPIRDKK